MDILLHATATRSGRRWPVERAAGPVRRLAGRVRPLPPVPRRGTDPLRLGQHRGRRWAAVLGYSARSTQDFERIRQDMLAPLVPVVIPVRAEESARQIQAELVARGQHRAVAIPDLLVAAVALAEGLAVLH